MDVGAHFHVLILLLLPTKLARLITHATSIMCMGPLTLLAVSSPVMLSVPSGHSHMPWVQVWWDMVFTPWHYAGVCVLDYVLDSDLS
jgi:hypothetical protein